MIMAICLLIKNVAFVNKWGGWIGKASLEIYLTHLIFLKYLDLSPVTFREVHYDLSTIMLSVISVFIGIALHKLITKCIHT